jgi:hypothetical protein
MFSLVERMLSLHKQLPEVGTPREKTALERQIEATDGQIDGGPAVRSDGGRDRGCAEGEQVMQLISVPIKSIYSKQAFGKQMITEVDVGDRGDTKLNHDMVLLNNKYTLKTAADVYDFVGSNPHLLPWLMETYHQIRNYFPSEILFLEVVTDPDEIGDKQLVIYICTDLSPQEAIDKLDQLDDNWWLNVSDASDSKLLIQVEYE